MRILLDLYHIYFSILGITNKITFILNYLFHLFLNSIIYTIFNFFLIPN